MSPAFVAAGKEARRKEKMSLAGTKKENLTPAMMEVEKKQLKEWRKRWSAMRERWGKSGKALLPSQTRPSLEARRRLQEEWKRRGILG